MADRTVIFSVLLGDDENEAGACLIINNLMACYALALTPEGPRGTRTHAINNLSYMCSQIDCSCAVLLTSGALDSELA